MERPTKKARLEVPEESLSDSEANDKCLDELDELQGKLSEIEQEENERVLEISRDYNRKKQTLYVERQQKIEKIPQFWMRVLLAHNIVSEMITELDQDVLRHLTKIDFCDEDKESRITMHFSPNDYFSNTSLYKVYKLDDDELDVDCSDIQWKNTEAANELKQTLSKELQNDKKEEDSDLKPSFFSMFDREDQDTDFLEIFRNDIWQNPLELFLSADFEEVDLDEEGNDDDDDQDDDEEH